MKKTDKIKLNKKGKKTSILKYKMLGDINPESLQEIFENQSYKGMVRMLNISKDIRNQLYDVYGGSQNVDSIIAAKLQIYETEKDRIIDELSNQNPNYDDIVNTIEEYEMNPNTIMDESGVTILMRLAETGVRRKDTSLIERILKIKNIDVNQKDYNGWTALMFATSGYEVRGFNNRDINTIQILLENGANLRLKNNRGETATDMLADPGDEIEEILDLLIEYGESQRKADEVLEEYEESMRDARADYYS
jgi:ankyrin repeat protein